MERLKNIDYNSFLNSEENSCNNKTISFFERENEGFFHLLKCLLRGEIESEEAFLEVIIIDLYWYLSIFSYVTSSLI